MNETQLMVYNNKPFDVLELCCNLSCDNPRQYVRSILLLNQTISKYCPDSISQWEKVRKEINKWAIEYKIDPPIFTVRILDLIHEFLKKEYADKKKLKKIRKDGLLKVENFLEEYDKLLEAIDILSSLTIICFDKDRFIKNLNIPHENILLFKKIINSVAVEKLVTIQGTHLSFMFFLKKIIRIYSLKGINQTAILELISDSISSLKILDKKRSDNLFDTLQRKISLMTPELENEIEERLDGPSNFF
ncbi:MAG: hypothetical protein JEY94_10785 [Melioribacteraceae bacterium]|nr:hypothetical protein [Melioribacteraceae bacterium]